MSLGTHVTLAVLAFCVIVGEPSHAGEHTPTHTVGLQNAEQTSQAVSPSLIVPFLVGLVVPCVLKLLLDYLAQFSEVRPVNTALLYAQIAVYIVAHYISLFIGVGTLLFAAVERPQNFADLACGAIGCLASMYSFDFTLTAASKFRKIWCCKQFVSLPPRTRRLLPNTLKKLIHIASGSDSCTELPFSQFLQLVVFSLQLADEQLLHNILDASCSGPTARRLAHLVKRLPSFRRALQTKNRFVFDAFALPAREATRPDSPNSVSFSERVDLATYFLKLQDKELLDTLSHPSIGSTSTCAAKLRQLYDRVVDPNNFSDVGRGYLLPDTLNKLIHVANRSDSCTELPFSQFLQLVEFCLQLADEQILHNILDASCSGPTARRLAHLAKRLPSFRRALQTKNRFVFDAFALPAREATRPDSPNSVSFSERVDLATYFLKLQDTELLDTLFHPSIGSTSTCAAKLRQLYDRVVDPNNFSDKGRGYLPVALKDLLLSMSAENHSTTLAFAVQVELIMLYLKLVGKKLSDNQVCMELGCVEDQEREMRVCDGEEGPWIRYWVQRFDGTLKATGRFGPSPVDIMKLAEEPPRFLLPASLEQDIIRLVLLLYARIASAGSSDGDSSHMNVYHQIMQQEGEQVFAY